jgi:hypothetical protein
MVLTRVDLQDYPAVKGMISLVDGVMLVNVVYGGALLVHGLVGYLTTWREL